MPLIIRLHSLFLTCLLLASCSSSGLYKPLPQSLEDKADVKGYKNIRAWGNAPSLAMEISAQQSLKQMKQAHHGKIPHVINALAISGGGSDGAFGAGVLYGWSKTGKRPKFQLVSGISTGALMAPFAFLGPQYDEQLKWLYTKISDDDIYKLNNPLAIIMDFIKPTLSRSVASNKPMKALMEQILTQEMLDAIGREHRKGNRLFIGTSQVNAERLVIWDIGAIAVSGNPHALKLVHKILLASSALPGIFPPQYFQVIAEGKKYKEMHLDGGIETQVMLYERAISPFARIYINESQEPIKRLYIIRNRKVSPEWQNVKPRLHSILERAVSTLTKTQGIGDLYRLYAFAQRDHVDYNLMYIPKKFDKQSKTMFDKRYMKKLFQLGVEKGQANAWEKHPPGLYESK
jgi:predicted acylesterase/phospholipase RssA